MAMTMFSSALVVAVAVTGMTVLRRPSPMICPPNFKIHNTSTPFNRYIFIGDIHGSSDGLREILIGAEIISPNQEEGKENGCHRLKTEKSNNTVVIQLGDIVDRGKNASIAWDCLDELQETSLKGGVIRLVGNHEIDWIQGNYRGSRDIPEYRRLLTSRIRNDILNKKIVGALSLFNDKILVTHAGLRQTMYNEMKKKYLLDNDGHDDDSCSTDDEICNQNNNKQKQQQNNANNLTSSLIAKQIQESLIYAVNKCPIQHSLTTSNLYRPICSELRNPLFGAGPERGGNGIGGPFWTDFSIISQINDLKDEDVSKFIQIVGHTAANCDVSASYKCQPIRSTKHAIAVDAAIYWGNRAYLEITLNEEGSNNRVPRPFSRKKNVNHEDINEQEEEEEEGEREEEEGEGKSYIVNFNSYTFQPSSKLWLGRNLNFGRRCGKFLKRQPSKFNTLSTTYNLIKKYINRL